MKALFRIAVLAAGSLVFISSAQATTYTYALTNGKFQTSTGPGKPNADYNGTFSGTMTWDTSINSGAGGWSAWNIKMSPGSPGGEIFTFSSSNSGFYKDIATNTTYSLGSTGSSAGCFSSPLANGSSADSGTTGMNYLTSAASGARCVGGNQVANGTQSVSGRPDLFSIYQVTNNNQPYAWTSGPANKGQYNYFRIPLDASLFTSNPGTLSVAYMNQGDQRYGWSNLQGDPAGGNPTTPQQCDGANALQPPDGSCPYSGNTQRISALLPTTSNIVQITLTSIDSTPTGNIIPADTIYVEVPAPVALFAPPLAFGWSRRFRQRTKSSKV